MTEAKENLHLLLVEDDEDDYRLTRSALQELPDTTCTLDWVTTYEAALERAERRRYDAFLVDYRLGAYTGLQLDRGAACPGLHDADHHAHRGGRPPDRHGGHGGGRRRLPGQERDQPRYAGALFALCPAAYSSQQAAGPGIARSRARASARPDHGGSGRDRPAPGAGVPGGSGQQTLPREHRQPRGARPPALRGPARVGGAGVTAVAGPRPRYRGAVSRQGDARMAGLSGRRQPGGALLRYRLPASARHSGERWRASSSTP